MEPAICPESEMESELESAARTIVDAGRQIHARGWSPATSSNYSVRLDSERCAITVSGRDKGALDVDGIMSVDMQGQALDGRKPSAETLLHTSLYQREPTIGAILHTHSMYATLVSVQAGTSVDLTDLELLKAFHGISSHQAELRLPVFDNNQDIKALAGEVEDWMSSNGTGHAYLIRGHGLYTWGTDMAEAMRQLEALEFLLEYTWHRQRAAG